VHSAKQAKRRRRRRVEVGNHRLGIEIGIGIQKMYFILTDQETRVKK